jgi:hypothetical protein
MEKKELHDKDLPGMGLVEFADAARLSSNLPEYAAVTLYMVCSFDGWVRAFNNVDEDPLSEKEVEDVRSAVSKRPVDPLKWNAIAEKLMKSWTADEKCARLLEEFSKVIDAKWDDGTFLMVLSFYMGLYSTKALEWVRSYSVKYHIDIPYNMTERLSAWKTRHPKIDHALLCIFARDIKAGAVKQTQSE